MIYSGSNREEYCVEVLDEGAGGEEGKLLDDNRNWESDMEMSLSDAREKLEGAIFTLGRLTDSNGEEGRLEKERQAIFNQLTDRTRRPVRQGYLKESPNS